MLINYECAFGERVLRMRTNVAEIRKYAQVFRTAIEEAHAANVFAGNPLMERFPSGSCGETTDLLGEFLVSNGINNLYYVCGTHYPDTGDDEKDFQGRQSHAWINIGYPMNDDSLIVDITGDQFKYNPEYGCYDKSVYVGKRDTFHCLFEIDDRDVHECHGIKDYDSCAQVKLFELYSEIVNRIECTRNKT